MADYYPLLARALDGLSERDQPARQAVYVRARSALKAQLASIKPPLSPAEIERESHSLEDAIDRVEELERRSAAEAGMPVDDLAAPDAVEADRRPRVEVQQPAIRRGGRRGRPLLMAVGLVVLITPIAVVAWLWRDKPQPAIPVVEAPRPAAASPAPNPTDPKFPERMGGGTPIPASPAPAGASPAVPTSPAGSAPAQPAAPAQPSAGAPSPASPAGASPDAGAPRQPQPRPTLQPPEQTPAVQPEIPVAQRAALIEEDTANPQQPQITAGRALWRLDAVNGGQGQPLETVIRSNVEIPEAGLTLALVMRRNRDSTLPASHTIELTFTTKAGEPRRSVRDVGLPQMQIDERSQGLPVAGLPVPVKDNVFLIGLSDLRADVDRNTEIILKRDWIQIPLRFASGQRAILLFEKGVSGDRVVTDAFKQWLQP